METKKVTIQQRERAIIHPQIERIRQEEIEFGSFWYEHRLALCVILSAIIFIVSMIPYLGQPR